MRAAWLLTLLIPGLVGCGSWEAPGTREQQATVQPKNPARDRGPTGKALVQDLQLSPWHTASQNTSCLQNLKSLCSLDLAGTSLNDDELEQRKDLDTLDMLGLHSTRITDRGLQRLGKLNRLRLLVLSNTPITDAGLRHLSGLTELCVLHLDGTDISDAGLQYLQSLTGLQTLVLTRTQVSEAGIRMLRDALPRLKIED